MNVAEKLSKKAESLLFRMACAGCPFQNSCSGVCGLSVKKAEKKEE